MRRQIVIHVFFADKNKKRRPPLTGRRRTKLIIYFLTNGPQERDHYVIKTYPPHGVFLCHVLKKNDLAIVKK